MTWPLSWTEMNLPPSGGRLSLYEDGPNPATCLISWLTSTLMSKLTLTDGIYGVVDAIEQHAERKNTENELTRNKIVPYDNN